MKDKINEISAEFKVADARQTGVRMAKAARDRISLQPEPRIGRLQNKGTNGRNQICKKTYNLRFSIYIATC